MGYFSKQVGRSVTVKDDPQPPSTAAAVSGPHFAAQVGKALAQASIPAAERCPRCNGTLAEDDGYMRCGGRCGQRWLVSEPGRLLDPNLLPFGVCVHCRPRLALISAEVGAICAGCHAEYLVLSEGVRLRSEAAPLGICHCCLPPQPLVKVATGLVCRNKPQQHYQLANATGKQPLESGDTIWLGSAPQLDQAAVTAAIDAALSANNAELTLFGLFAPTQGRSC